jgi:hypothetical protein
MSTAATALATAVSPAPPTGESASHVFGEVGVLDEQAVRLAVLVDPRFLTECGSDSAGQVLAPPPDHPQLGWTPPVVAARVAASVAGCMVPGCSRPPGSHGLCRAHRARQVLRGMSVAEFAADPARRALEEITRIRRLIHRITGDIAGLDAVERAQIDDAVAVVRRHRAAHAVPLGLPTVPAAAPTSLINPEATA